MTVSVEKRQQIIEDVNRSWDELIGVIRQFSNEELEQPDVIGIWSLKDLIGHLETWDRIAIKKIGYAEKGQPLSLWREEVPDYKNIDQFNETGVEGSRHRSIDDLWSATFATHRELLEILARTPVLSRDLIRVDTYGHYRDHLRDIQRWQAGR